MDLFPHNRQAYDAACRLLAETGKAAVIPTFADQSEIPVWAADAIYSLSAVGILTPTGDRITPADTVTRAQAAQMLSALMQYREE